MNYGEKRCAVYETIKELGECTFEEITVRVPNIPKTQIMQILEFLEKKKNIIVRRTTLSTTYAKA